MFHISTPTNNNNTSIKQQPLEKDLLQSDYCTVGSSEKLYKYIHSVVKVRSACQKK